MPDCTVVLNADNVVVKSSESISLSEVEAMRVAARADIPVPRVLDVSKTGKEMQISMSYIQGETLGKLWPDLSADERLDIATQLRGILDKMRALEPPPDFIGCCDGTGVRDTRVHFTYDGPVCKDEAEFNAYLDSSLIDRTPAMLRAAFRGQLRTDHRIVFTHGDLAPRNIMIKDGKITGLIDWEESGWYPSYWEVVKFFERHADYDWKGLADVLFSDDFSNEIVTYTAMAKWRYP